MNRHALTSSVLAAVGAGLLLLQASHEEPANDASVRAISPGKVPEEWLQMRRLAGSEMSLAALQRAQQDFTLFVETTRRRLPARATQAWQFLGPTNIGGRVLDIVIDPLTANTIYAATASGGLWKSTDAGDTFTLAWPFDNAQAVGALAISPTGVLYAGVGEGAPNGSSPTLGNKGIFASTDGGANWTALGLHDSARIGRIAIDPNDETRLFVAATGPVFAPGGERGVYRSTDAGATWQLVLPGANATTGAAEVIIDPGNPNRVFAVLWQHIRAPEVRNLGGVGSGVFRSLDGGDTWARLAGGLPPSDADIGRIGLGMAPSNPDRLYATYIDATGYFTAFYTSTNGGSTWTTLPTNSTLANSQSSFGWWFGRTWVDPADEQRVFVAGVTLVRSTTAGASWNQDFTVHADQHVMAWDANIPGRVYLGNDGGVYRSENNGSGPWSFASVQPFTQFYTVDVGEQDPTRLVGGTQDNRCLRSWTATASTPWNAFGCGDGLETLINYVNQNIVYGCSQRGSCGRSTNGGETLQAIGATTSARRAWQTPLLFDPNDPQVMYYAGDIVNRSTNGGVSWSVISPSLAGPDPFPADNYTFGTITAVAVAKSDPDTLYVGTDDARIWYSHDQGVNWTQSIDPGLPARWVTDIEVDPGNADVAYLAYSGYREGDNTPYVFVTQDGGVSWADITANLPAAPINTLALNPRGGLLAGGDFGVFYSDALGAQWTVVGTLLPRAPSMDLRVHAPSESLFVATFGRGLWSIPLPSPDGDADGIDDSADNCVQVANPAQTDTDSDGIGNRCDPDVNNDCVVDFLDLGLLKADFFAVGALQSDFNTDGVVDFLDLGIMKSLFFAAPGPAGTPNLCTP